MNFEFSSATRLVFGEGTFGRLGELVPPFGKKALLVTGARALTASGHLARAQEMLEAAGVAAVAYNRIPPNPTVEVVDEGAEVARREQCDVVIGLGGGSTMDSAKAIAVGAFSGLSARTYLTLGPDGTAPPASGALPVICVTSTAGTSSELTPFAVVTLSDCKEKKAIRSPFIQPRVSIADPELTYSAPPHVTAATGIDVLCHALEAFLNGRAQPITDLTCAEAIRLVGEYLPRAMDDGSDREARRHMMLANCLAGYGLANCGATVMHAMEHPVSGHYPHVAHGAGLAAFIKPWAARMATVMPEKLARVGQLLGASPSLAGHDAVQAGVAALGDLLAVVGLDLTLRELGVEGDLLEQMAADAMRYMGGAVANTPGDLNAGDLLELYEAAY
jgi:alcohol dehydrogenase